MKAHGVVCLRLLGGDRGGGGGGHQLRVGSSPHTQGVTFLQPLASRSEGHSCLPEQLPTRGRSTAHLPTELPESPRAHVTGHFVPADLDCVTCQGCLKKHAHDLQGVEQFSDLSAKLFPGQNPQFGSSTMLFLS